MVSRFGMNPKAGLRLTIQCFEIVRDQLDQKMRPGNIAGMIVILITAWKEPQHNVIIPTASESDARTCHHQSASPILKKEARRIQIGSLCQRG